ncbi:hypothetical protein JCM5353_007090 [Sporobolomyces roseus]
MGKRQDASLRPTSKSKRGPSSSTSVSKGRAKTRSDKPKLIEDPDREEQVLSHQLRENGLYAANILGDGNCLFRALSDQLFGSPSQHLQLRNQICDFLGSDQHQERFKVFVDLDDYKSGWSGYVREMRQPGTYGTNIELSAFVHLYQRSIKIFQPGLVYVMQPEPSTTSSPSSSTSTTPLPPPPPLEDSGNGLSAREKRMKARQEKSLKNTTKGLKGKGKSIDEQREGEGGELESSGVTAPQEKKEEEEGPLCIVYHSWEHYSSLRNLKGPHTGPPRLRIARPVSPSLVEHPSASNSVSPPPPPSPSSPPTPDDAEPSPPPHRIETEADVPMIDSCPLATNPNPSLSPPTRRSRTSLRNSSTTLPPAAQDRPPPPRLSRTYSKKDRLPSSSNSDPRSISISHNKNKRDLQELLISHSNSCSSSRAPPRDEEEDSYLSSGQHRGQSPALTNSSSSTTTSNSSTTTNTGETSSTSTNDKKEEEEVDQVETEESSDSDIESLSVQNLLRPNSNHLKLLPSSSSSSVSPEKRPGGGGGRRGPTGRDKKELGRMRRMERRRQPTTSQKQEEGGRVLRSGKKLGGGGAEEEGLGGKVRELYI